MNARVATMIVIAACSAPPDPVAPSPKQSLTAVYAGCIKQLQSGDPKFEHDCLAPGFVARVVDGADVTSPSAAFLAVKRAFPDIAISPQRVLVAGRDVFAVSLVTGTQRGTLDGPTGPVAATNRSFGVMVLEHLTFDAAGLATAASLYIDPIGVLGQLGALPAGADPTQTAASTAWEGAPVVATRAEDATERANVATLRTFTDAVNSHRTTDVLALLADDAVDTDAGRDAVGKPSVEKRYQFVLTTVPDYHRDLEALYPIGAFVVATGIKTGTFGGGKVRLHFAELYRFREGKIAEVRRFYNTLTMMAQIEASAR